MAIQFRLLLIAGSFFTFLFFLNNIKKSRLKISHSIFWIVFGLVLLALALVPEGIIQVSKLLGIQSPANLVYVVIIFMMIIKMFTNTLKMSKMSEQITALTQELAIYKLEAEKNQEGAKTE